MSVYRIRFASGSVLRVSALDAYDAARIASGDPSAIISIRLVVGR